VHIASNYDRASIKQFNLRHNGQGKKELETAHGLKSPMTANGTPRPPRIISIQEFRSNPNGCFGEHGWGLIQNPKARSPPSAVIDQYFFICKSYNWFVLQN